jgi:hypothetical protein
MSSFLASNSAVFLADKPSRHTMKLLMFDIGGNNSIVALKG